MGFNQTLLQGDGLILICEESFKETHLCVCAHFAFEVENIIRATNP